jgi:lysophospholipase L1-like esterase
MLLKCAARAVIVTALSLGIMVGVLGSSGAIAGAATTTSTSPTFYLAVGASASVGVQPTTTTPHGEPTSRGYANDLVALEAAQGVDLQLTQVGCPGESTAAAIYGGDRCYPAPSSQMSTAVTFLSQHTGDAGLVTVDLGFNNVVPCLKLATGATSCVLQGIADIRQQLPMFLHSLQTAAGPNVTFVGVGHYDPYVADARNGSAGRAHAATSLWAINLLNRTLHDAYQASGIPMANVARAFSLHVTTPVVLAGSGVVATNVAQACLLTWMCQPLPLGPNLHPNDAGYHAIADAIARVVAFS